MYIYTHNEHIPCHASLYTFPSLCPSVHPFSSPCCYCISKLSICQWWDHVLILQEACYILGSLCTLQGPLAETWRLLMAHRAPPPPTVISLCLWHFAVHYLSEIECSLCCLLLYLLRQRDITELLKRFCQIPTPEPSPGRGYVLFKTLTKAHWCSLKVPPW